jgi:hypothetical protein
VEKSVAEIKEKLYLCGVIAVYAALQEQSLIIHS